MISIIKVLAQNMEEVWKDIAGYEGFYQVSNIGNIKALERTVVFSNGKNFVYKEQNRKVQRNVEGYRIIGLNKGGKMKIKRVARLVAEAFLPNPENLPEVNHKDEDKENDFVYLRPDGTIDFDKSNLEWCSRSYNINYKTRNKRVGDYFIKRVYKYSMDGQLLEIYNSLSEAAKANSYLVGNMSVACRKVKEGATCGNCFYSYEPLSKEQLSKAAMIKQFYIEHKNRHPSYNDIKAL